jgi:hypothetical protein
MKKKHNGKVVLLHLAARYPFAGVMWQLIHHLVGLRELGLEVYYLEDHGAWVYDPLADAVSRDASRNLKLLAEVMERWGFRDRWAFFDVASGEYVGMGRERSLQLLAEADAVINLCGATWPRDEHRRTRCLVYLETDPGVYQVRYAQGDESARGMLDAHRVSVSPTACCRRRACDGIRRARRCCSTSGRCRALSRCRRRSRP